MIMPPTLKKLREHIALRPFQKNIVLKFVIISTFYLGEIARYFFLEVYMTILFFTLHNDIPLFR